MDAGAEFSLYPNPVRDGNLTISLNGLDAEADKAHIEVISSFGKLIHTETVAIGSGQMLQNVYLSEANATGMYFVTVRVGEQAFFGKVMVN